MPNLRKIGSIEERAAAAFLERHGCRILDRNFHDGRSGEIDLVAYDGETVVFVEVKYRSSDRCGLPEEAVTGSKQRTICRTARFYLIRKGLGTECPIRFDVVAIRPAGNGQLQVRWIRNAFPYHV